MNNIGPGVGGDAYSAFINSTNKVPAVPVTRKAAEASSTVSKGNDSHPDNFLSSPAGNTAIVTANASLMPRRVKDTSNDFWGDVGAVEEATEKEGGILSPLNTKESRASFVPVVLEQQAKVKQGLIKAMNGSLRDSFLSTILENV
jgi:hypothetical protein